MNPSQPRAVDLIADRTGQVWRIHKAVHLIVSPPKWGLGMSSDEASHVSINLENGERINIGEVVDEPWELISTLARLA